MNPRLAHSALRSASKQIDIRRRDETNTKQIIVAAVTTFPVDVVGLSEFEYLC